MIERIKAYIEYRFKNPKYIRVNIPFNDFFVCYKLLEDGAYLFIKDAMKEVYDYYNMQLNEELLDKKYYEFMKKEK